jgi:hypothetical protein
VRALVGVFVKLITDLDEPRFLRGALEELDLVVDAILNEDPRTSTACSTVVPNEMVCTHKMPTACSKSASSMMLGLLPPSSSVTAFKLPLGAVGGEDLPLNAAVSTLAAGWNMNGHTATPIGSCLVYTSFLRLPSVYEKSAVS